MTATREAVDRMIDLLAAEHGLNPIDAYMLLSVCGDLRISEIVDHAELDRFLLLSADRLHLNDGANPRRPGSFRRRADARRFAPGARRHELHASPRRDFVHGRGFRLGEIADGAFDHALAIASLSRGRDRSVSPTAN